MRCNFIIKVVANATADIKVFLDIINKENRRTYKIIKFSSILLL